MRSHSSPVPQPTFFEIHRLRVLMILLSVATAMGGENARAQNAGVTPASTTAAAGHLVHIPLTIDYLALGAALRQQLYTDHGRAPIWNGSDQCQYFYAEHPHFSRAGNNVKLETDGSLMIGVMMGSQCVSPVVWNGII